MLDRSYTIQRVEESNKHEVEPSPISRVLSNARRRAGLTIPQVSERTGIPVPTLNVVFAGRRRRGVRQVQVVPKSQLVTRIAAVVGATSDELREVGYGESARMLEESPPIEEFETHTDDRVTQALVSARRKILADMLRTFTDDDLREELERRAAERDAKGSGL